MPSRVRRGKWYPLEHSAVRLDGCIWRFSSIDLGLSSHESFALQAAICLILHPMFERDIRTFDDYAIISDILNTLIHFSRFASCSRVPFPPFVPSKDMRISPALIKCFTQVALPLECACT